MSPIPDFVDDLLPLFIGSITEPAHQAPWDATIVEFIERFGTSHERLEILEGLLEYRGLLKQLGFHSGFQWLCGSFVEHCEEIRGRPPGDVDVVTFCHSPSLGLDVAQLLKHQQRSATPLVGKPAKRWCKCDGFFIDLGEDPEVVVDHITYWLTLFGHQRYTVAAKGFVKVRLDDPSGAADITDVLNSCKAKLANQT